MKIAAQMLVALTATTIQVQGQNRQSTTVQVKSVESYALESFFNTATSGSIILSGSCGKKRPLGDDILTEAVELPTPDRYRRIDDALTVVSDLSAHYVWSREDDGLVQLRDNRASAAILRLKLERVELTNAVTLEDAVEQVLAAPGIKGFLHRNHIDMVPVFTGATFWNQHVADSLKKAPSAPKYSRTWTNLTLEEALDRTVRVFPGVWVYAECPGRISVDSSQVWGRPHWSAN
jgi:hypothetical protein